MLPQIIKNLIDGVDRPVLQHSENRKASIPLCRDEGFMRFVVPPWFGNE
jgi:hypothetical protein